MAGKIGVDNRFIVGEGIEGEEMCKKERCVMIWGDLH